MNDLRPVLTFGETLALISPDAIGPLAHSLRARIGIGGAESNVAIGLARLGISVTWIGRVGDDPLGRLVRREIAAEGVDARAIVDATASTGLMVKERRTVSSSSIYYYRADSAGSRLVADDVPVSAIRNASLLHVTGITPALSLSAREASLYAMRSAADFGIPVSFDLNYRSKLWTRENAASFYREAIPLADLVFAGADEARIATTSSSLDPVELAEHLIALGCNEVVIKLGRDGALSLTGSEPNLMQAIQIEAVDTVGAGDAFAAGYLSEYLRASSFGSRLETAVRAGAWACLIPGDWEGLPTRAELDQLEARDSDPVRR